MEAGQLTIPQSEIEFNETSHRYKVKGVDTPSVTQLISVLHPDVYGAVPRRTLEKKAAYGTALHGLVESAAQLDVWPSVVSDGFMKLSLDRFKALQEQFDIKVSSCEQHVFYEEDGVPLYAGTYDMIGTVGGVPSVIDIKTTEKMHTDMLEEQLPMYAMAIEQMCPEVKFEKLYCLWLPRKGLGDLVEVKMPNKDLLLKRVRDAYEAFWARQR